MSRKPTKELKKLIAHIEEDYAGDYAAVSRDLNHAIYLLHYLERDVTDPLDVQDISHALHKLSQCFYRAHSERKLRENQDRPP